MCSRCAWQTPFVVRPWLLPRLSSVCSVQFGVFGRGSILVDHRTLGDPFGFCFFQHLRNFLHLVSRTYLALLPANPDADSFTLLFFFSFSFIYKQVVYLVLFRVLMYRHTCRAYCTINLPQSVHPFFFF